MAKPDDNAGTNGISKSDAVRKAVAEGWTKPAEGAMFVKTMYGIEISPSHFSNIKSTLRLGKKRRGRPPGGKNRVKAEAQPVPAPSTRAARTSGGIEIEAIAQVKELVNRVGAETVKKLVTMLS